MNGNGSWKGLTVHSERNEIGYLTLCLGKAIRDQLHQALEEVEEVITIIKRRSKIPSGEVIIWGGGHFRCRTCPATCSITGSWCIKYLYFAVQDVITSHITEGSKLIRNQLIPLIMLRRLMANLSAAITIAEVLWPSMLAVIDNLTTNSIPNIVHRAPILPRQLRKQAARPCLGDQIISWSPLRKEMPLSCFGRCGL